MDPIRLIVTALATGATVMLNASAGELTKDAYAKLKQMLQERYLSINVEYLEERPDSEHRQAAIQEDLADTDARNDTELLRLAQALQSAMKSNKVEAVKGISVVGTESGSMQIDDVTAQGRGNVTGVEVKDSKVKGAININGVRAEHRLPATGQAQSETTPIIKILFLAANPLDAPYLRIDEESRAIKEALHKADYRTHFEVETELAMRIGDLQDRLLHHDPHIVHFCGHAEQSDLILQDTNGNRAEVSGEKIGELFSILQGNTRCVVLNACHTHDQAAAMAQHVDCVVGISDKISDEAGRKFAIAFYRGLGYARTVAEAYRLGCSEIDLHNLDEVHKPVLSHRVDPNTVTFVNS